MAASLRETLIRKQSVSQRVYQYQIPYDLLLTGEGFKYIVVGDYPWAMPLDDDEEMKKAILDRSQTAFHHCGTAHLSKSIEIGVVDPKLKVHGVRKLRIIDASVIPVTPDCRIQNSVYMIGEKGALRELL